MPRDHHAASAAKRARAPAACPRRPAGSQGRREFLEALAAGGAGLVLSGCAGRYWREDRVNAAERPVPSYLEGHEELYAKDPRAAAVEWFREARFGLFIHYGLYSLLGRHEWVQLREKIPVAEYEKLKGRFTAEKFDADAITDLALQAGMKYVNITTRHHDGFCLFDTAQTDFKSTNSPAGRDLVKEVALACRRKGLGFFMYYSHGRDWRHPHAPNNDRWGGRARPDYDPPEPAYAYGEAHDLGKYVDFMSAQIRELLTDYGPVAGIWLDGIAVPLHPRRGTGASTADFRCPELYDMIHSMQPQVLVSYKQGLIGTEDFLAPERKSAAKVARPLEICDTLQPRGWGYIRADDGKHKGADEVMRMLARAALASGSALRRTEGAALASGSALRRTEGAARGGANLLLNTGPLGDGSLHPEDVATLREVGAALRERGWP